MSIVSAVDITIGPNTSGGLKKAVEKVGDGDIIYMRNGVYTCESNRGIVINKSVTIQGLGKNVVIDAQGKDRILTLEYSIEKNISSFPKYSVILKNLRMINGKTKDFGGAIYVDTAKNDSYEEHIEIAFKQNKLSVIGCTFINNNADRDGGAIYFSSIGCLTVSNSIFKNNTARAGGAIRAKCPNFTLKNCTLTNNTATFGGGAIAGETASYAEVSSSIVTNNKTEDGRAISDVINLINCTFKSNTAKYYGAIYVSSNKVEINVSSCTFINNKVDRDGGAIYFSSIGCLTVSNSIFTNNKARSGEQSGLGFQILL